MRQLTNRYEGECRKCGTSLPVGTEVIYEKRVGIFCLTCAPTDTEEIREYRQKAADRKADRLEEWAEKREKKATAQLTSHPEIRGDIAFITQPGHIPFRSKMIETDRRACESLDTAKRFRDKADNLRHVRVKGDAERGWQAKREAVLSWILVGMEVETVFFGRARVLKINKITALVSGGRVESKAKIDLAFLRRVE